MLGDLYAAEGYVVLCLDGSAAVLQSGRRGGRRSVARAQRMHRQNRRAGLRPRRQARLSRRGRSRCRLRGFLLRRRSRRSTSPRASAVRSRHAFRREGPGGPAGSRGAGQDGSSPAVRMSQSIVYPGVAPGFARASGPSYDKAVGGAGAFALDRAAAQGDGAALRSRGAVGEAHASTSSAPAMSTATMRTMVAGALRQPHPDHDRRGRPARSRPVLRATISSRRCPPDTRLVPISRTIGADRVVDEMLFCFTHDIEIDWMLPGVAPTGQVCRDPARRDRQFPRRQALSRAHLLGSGERAGADRAARSRGAAGRRRRDREEAARRDPAIEHVDEALGGECAEGSWRRPMTIEISKDGRLCRAGAGAGRRSRLPARPRRSPRTPPPPAAKPAKFDRQAAAVRPVEDQGLVGEDPDQPLRQQLHRRRQAAQADHRAARRARFRQGARLSDQRAETRGIDRDQFDDIARSLFRRPRRGEPARAGACRGAGPRLRQLRAVARRIRRDGQGRRRRLRLGIC